MMRAMLANGTRIAIRGPRTVIILPDGRVIRGRPQRGPAQAETARELGYGDDVGAMIADHDPLHALLCDFLRLPTSFALSGGNPDLAEAEETAVLAVQRFMRRAGGRLPLTR